MEVRVFSAAPIFFAQLFGDSIFLSARKTFSVRDDGWQSYQKFIGFPTPDEIYSLDCLLNGYIGDSGSLFIENVDEIGAWLPRLPKPESVVGAYYQLAINVSVEPEPPLGSGVVQLGYDLGDQYQTSSLLNCGPWEGNLAPIAKRLNQYGLLSLNDAQLAQNLLPQVWGVDEPHAHVDLWLVCEVLEA